MSSAGARGPRAEHDAAPSTIRCFVALQPDPPALDRLEQVVREQHARFPSARRMRRENLHLTLAVIGALQAGRARQVAATLAGQTPPSFDWALDSLGAFAGARVLWAGSNDGQLEALAARARALLDDLGVRFDRKPFVAHVTLLRDLPRGAADDAARRIEPPIVWRAQAPLLLESRTESGGVRYLPVAPRGSND